MEDLRHLRKHRQDIVRPFRMWLYLPTSGWAFVGSGLLTLALGASAYIIWKRVSPTVE